MQNLNVGHTAVSEITTPGTYHLKEGIIVEWLRDGKIVSFHVRNNSRNATDIYINAQLAVIEKWPSEKPFLMLVIANYENSAITSYMRERLNKTIIPASQHLRGRTAVVVKKGPFTQIARGFMQLHAATFGKRMLTNLFFDRESALAWIEVVLR